MKILELPFRERPALELLNLDGERAEPDANYAGYGWTRVDEIWLDGERIADALVLALHSADDGEPMPDDIELEFELPDAPPVAVLASQFLDQWLPTLPPASAIVLALCNPHAAVLHVNAPVPVYYATADVESWRDHLDEGHRIRLATDGSWVRLPS